MEIIGHYSNTPNLLTDLRRTTEVVSTMIIEDTTPTNRAWRLKDRLSPADLVESFQLGITIAELVTRYGISRTSIRTMLRQHGAWRYQKFRTAPRDEPHH